MRTGRRPSSGLAAVVVPERLPPRLARAQRLRGAPVVVPAARDRDGAPPEAVARRGRAVERALGLGEHELRADAVAVRVRGAGREPRAGAPHGVRDGDLAGVAVETLGAADGADGLRARTVLGCL